MSTVPSAPSAPSAPTASPTLLDSPPEATRTAAVIVPQWRLLAALDRLQRQQEKKKEQEKEQNEPRGQNAAPAAATAAPVILVERHRVIHADAAAAEAGVAIGMRRRSAQAACPEAIVLEADREHEAALFELVAAAVDTVAAGVDVLRPGVVLMAARGPARHQGGDRRLAERIMDAVADLTGWDCLVGIADGPFAALLAARTGRVVRPGRSAEYLAPHSIETLRHAPVGPGWGHRDQPSAVSTGRLELAEVTDLLTRLGIATLEGFAALPATSVADRFGPDVAQLHLLARGGEPTPPAAHRPEQPVEVLRVLDPPLVRVDQAAFAARPMAEELHGMLTARGMICTRLRIIGRTAGGQEMERTWRHDGALSPADVVDRVRWQCDGWITRSKLTGTETGEITQLVLQPMQLIPAGEGAPALWGSAGESAQRAGRAFARAQGLAGEDAVLVPAEVGGRLLADQVRLVPWRSEKPPRREGPWPGAFPRPLPATVFRTPPPVELLDDHGQAVVVTSRGLLSADPVLVRIPGRDTEALVRRGFRVRSGYRVRGHSAPVLLDERWWAADGRRAARLQLVLGRDPEAGTGSTPGKPPEEPGEERAVLALSREGSWMLEGLYD